MGLVLTQVPYIILNRREKEKKNTSVFARERERERERASTADTWRLIPLHRWPPTCTFTSMRTSLLSWYFVVNNIFSPNIPIQRKTKKAGVLPAICNSWFSFSTFSLVSFFLSPPSWARKFSFTAYYWRLMLKNCCNIVLGVFWSDKTLFLSWEIYVFIVFIINSQILIGLLLFLRG